MTTRRVAGHATTRTRPSRTEIHQHATLVQGVLTKLGQHAAGAKAGALTVTTVAAGAALTARQPLAAAAGIAVVLALLVLDAGYLRQRRMYRRLYDAAVAGTAEWLSLDARPYAAGCTWWAAIRSWAVLLPYLPLVAVLAACAAL
ncbi:MAG TPA: hypothetical protein VGD67_12055 [Pseudonocardiaceae bacterium]